MHPVAVWQGAYTFAFLQTGRKSLAIKKKIKLRTYNHEALCDMDSVIYCISLKDAKSRRRRVRSFLQESKIDFEFIDAIDGRLLGIEDMGQYDLDFRKRFFDELSKNEIACSLSHQKALKKFLTTSYGNLILLEDDAEVLYSLESILELLSGLPCWDVVRLENRRQERPHFEVAKDGKITLFVPKNNTHGATGIIYSRSGARKVLSMNSKIKYGFDTQFILSGEYGIKYLAAYPEIVRESGCISTIGKRGEDQKNNKKYRFVARLIRIYQSIRKRITRIFVYISIKMAILLKK